MVLFAGLLMKPRDQVGSVASATMAMKVYECYINSDPFSWTFVEHKKWERWLLVILQHTEVRVIINTSFLVVEEKLDIYFFDILLEYVIAWGRGKVKD